MQSENDTTAGHLTQKRVAEIRARTERATPGPWRVGYVEKWHVYCPHPNGIAPELGRVLFRVNEHFPYIPDVEFVANARQDISDLLAAVGAQREELLGLRRDRALMWSAINDRRCALLDKQECTPLFPEEARELERLDGLVRGLS